MSEQEPVTGKTIKLARASFVANHNPPIYMGLQYQDLAHLRAMPYHESIRLCRYFYRRDGIANTVVNRIAEITTTQLRNRRKVISGEGTITDQEIEVFNIVARRIQPYIKNIILSYLIDGMAIPQYELVKIMGTRISNKLGRTRYYLPESITCRNPEHVLLKRTLVGGKRRAFIKIPSEDIGFVTNRGVWADGTSDLESFNRIKEEMPEYIAAIQSGKTVFPIDDYIIYRNLLSFSDYPQPYLESALNPLDHKRYLKMMDRSIATRAVEAFRHIKVGSDEFPADDDDIDAAKSALNQTSSTDRVYNLFTNHTIEIAWIIPPLDILMDATKYQEANADIFFALGFPRILTVGETEKSNAADNKIASLGIMATLKAIQSDVIEWVKRLYLDVADKNDLLRVPEPYFAAIPLSDVSQLIQYARDMIETGTVSKDTVSAFYGSDYDSELEQREYEKETDIEEETPLETNSITQQSISPENGIRSTPEQPE